MAQDVTHAPWTNEQVDSLNWYQLSGRYHPFTCAGDRKDLSHFAAAAILGHDDTGLLIATPDGWRCPACDYKQDWAHTFMANWAWDVYAKERANGG